ncbi:helix-turn-helix transcriptional regulator [Emticicia fluvialis]|uniref:helix-turn-helix transcriptional regulator n=1 Tax=Emticicia fluvialis TaxID=2974474 RepID=UPI0021666D58|nr:helix-turn-helix transcriptional regulator [Emticicia fluvialis]
MSMHTGDKIRGIRFLKGYSQENMADMLNLSRMAYGEIERGKTDVSDSRLQQIADVLGVSPADILSFGEKVNNFFDQCKGAIGINTSNGSVTNNYNPTKEDLEMEKLKLEIEKLKAEKEKAELEAKYWREKNGSQN